MERRDAETNFAGACATDDGSRAPEDGSLRAQPSAIVHVSATEIKAKTMFTVHHLASDFDWLHSDRLSQQGGVMAKAAKPVPNGFHTVTASSDAGRCGSGNRVVQESIRRRRNRPPPWSGRQDHARRNQDWRLAHHRERCDARHERTEGIRRVSRVTLAVCRQLRRAVRSRGRRRSERAGAAGRSVLGRPGRCGDRSRGLYMVDRHAQGRSHAAQSSSSARRTSSNRWRRQPHAEADCTARETFSPARCLLFGGPLIQRPCSTSIRSS